MEDTTKRIQEIDKQISQLAEQKIQLIKNLPEKEKPESYLNIPFKDKYSSYIILHSNIFDAIYNYISDVIVLLDKNYRIINCNNSCSDTFFLNDKSEIIGKKLIDLVSSEDREFFKSYLNNKEWKRKENKHTLYFKRNNNQLFPAEYKINQLSNNTEYFIGVIKSIEHQKMLEEKALSQIEILAKQSIVHNELRNAKTVNDLKTDLCNQLILLTEASEVWFLNSVRDNLYELFISSKTEFQTYRFKLNSGIKKKVDIFINTPKDIYSFKETELLILPHFNKNIAYQYIIGSNLNSGNWHIMGLNYDTNQYPTLEQDQEFLRIIFNEIFSSIEKLKSYEKIIENEQRFKALTEELDSAILILSEDLKYKYISPSIKNFNFTPEEFLSKPAGFYTHPDDKNIYIEAIQSILKNPGSTTNIRGIRIFHTDNSIIYVSMSITNLLDFKGVEGIVINAKDITESIEYENKLKLSEENFKKIFNSSSDAIFICDYDGNFIEVNDVTINRTGFARDDFMKMNIRHIISHVPEEKIKNFINQALKKGLATEEESYTNNFGELVYFEISARPIKYFNTDALILRSINITDKKEADRKLLEAIVRTEENERARFARDLHDGIGPYLSAVKMFLISLGREERKEERDKIIDKSIDSFDEIIRNVKEISNNISPRVMKHFGLVSAIHAFVKKLNYKIPIKIISNMEGVRLNENTEMALFRITTELINNTLKYAQATQMILTINLNNMQVLDYKFEHNGKGFNFEKTINKGRGNGLLNIIHRIKSLNGTYSFKTDIDQALQFEASFKINN